MPKSAHGAKSAQKCPKVPKVPKVPKSALNCPGCPHWDISRLKHPFYALVYAAKGLVVLYKIYNIIFEHGFDPSPLFEQCSKNCNFLSGWLPLPDIDCIVDVVHLARDQAALMPGTSHMEVHATIFPATDPSYKRSILMHI